MTKFSVKKPMTIFVAVILVLILGVVSFTKMKTDLLPSIDLPYAIVMTTYIGASPEEVEATVSKPIEQSMATLSNIKNVSSVSSENYSMIILEFDDLANMDSLSIDIRESLDLLEGVWDNDMIGTPIVIKINPDMLPVMVAAVDVEGMNHVEVSNYVTKDLLAKVDSVDGVASVTTSGVVEEEIHVIITDEKIEALISSYPFMPVGEMITKDMVTGILKAQNFAMPAGYITEENVDYLIRVGDKLDSIETMQNLKLLDFGIEGLEPIKLGDVAEIFKKDNSSENYAKVNGNDAIILSIQKQTSYTTAQVSKDLQKRFDELMEKDSNLHVNYLMDQGMYIDLIVNSVLNNLIYGAILAILILLFFLKDIKPTVSVAISIPISVIFAMVLMYFSGITLNVISLSGLAVGVGMLVDNSIVVIENIYRLRNKGVSAIQAAVTGARQVSGAIIASTLTTICVFVPIVFIEGITRQLFVDMALTIGYSLFASLIVALTVVPAISAKLLKKTTDRKHPIMNAISTGYEKLLRISLKWKPVVLILAIVMLVVSMMAAMNNGTSFMPSMDSTQISVSITPPKDATMEEKVQYMNEVMEQIQKIPDVQTVGGMISEGANGAAMMMPMGNGQSVYVLLKEDKTRSSQDVATQINHLFTDKEYEVSASGSSMDISALGGSGISLNIQGDELEILREIALEVSDIVENVEGTTEVSDGMEQPAPEIRITVDKDKAIRYGLSVAQVLGTVSDKLKETEAATTIRYEQVDYPVLVMTEESTKELTIKQLKDFILLAKDKEGNDIEVRLDQIATITEGIGMSNIQRKNGIRYITVTAAIEEGHNIGIVSKAVDKALEKYDLPSGYKIVSAGEDETIGKAMKDMLLMLLLAVAFIYLIMVAGFQSLKSPFIIMFTMPLAFTGGFIGLWITGNEVSVISMLGFVMLAGIIVNNGIVLVDYINQLRIEGVAKKEALIEAGKTRLRPIFMTGLTTVLGLSTMAIGVGMGADMVQPIAIVTIGGLLYATITTLFVIPVLYDLFNRKPIKFISEEELKVYEEI